MTTPEELVHHLLDLRCAAELSGCRIREWRLTHDQIKQIEVASGSCWRARAPGDPRLRFGGIPIRVVGQGNFA